MVQGLQNVLGSLPVRGKDLKSDSSGLNTPLAHWRKTPDLYCLLSEPSNILPASCCQTPVDGRMDNTDPLPTG